MATRDEDTLKDQEADTEELSVNEGVDELPEGDAPADSRVEDDEVEERDEEETAAPDSPEKEVEEEAVSPRHEHTLEDLAEEETPLPSGVTPQRPKSFNMEPSFNSNFPQSGVYTSRGGGGKKGSLLALVLIALLVIGGSIYLLKSRLNKTAASPEPTLTTVTEELSTPTPTPTPSLDRSKYKIRVLNGTSTSGLAASVSGKLKDLGYQIDRTGNATNSAFTKTVIQAKSGLAELIEALIADLAPSYSASAGGTLKDADAADAEVIIGKN
jgi:hypothetical protein